MLQVQICVVSTNFTLQPSKMDYLKDDESDFYNSFYNQLPTSSFNSLIGEYNYQLIDDFSLIDDFIFNGVPDTSKLSIKLGLNKTNSRIPADNALPFPSNFVDLPGLGILFPCMEEQYEMKEISPCNSPNLLPDEIKENNYTPVSILTPQTTPQPPVVKGSRYKFPKPYITEGKKTTNISMLSNFKNVPKYMNKIIGCNHCDNQFNQMKEYALHLDDFSLDPNNFCPDAKCVFNKIGFLKKMDLRIHILNTHLSHINCRKNIEDKKTEINKISPKLYKSFLLVLYVCNDENCARIFYRKDALTRHCKKLHCDPTPSQCNKRRKKNDSNDVF